MIILLPETRDATKSFKSREAAREYVQMLYRGLTTQMKAAKWARSVDAITETSIPVVHVLAEKPDHYGGRPAGQEGPQILLDISIVQGYHQGEKGIALVQQLQAALPSLRPLFLALKTLLLNHGLCCSLFYFRNSVHIW